jgi:hypothetical protein
MSTWLVLVAVALGAPGPVTLSTTEVAALTAGEIVVRPPTSTGEMVGVVDIPGTTAARVWDAVLDFDLRTRSVSAIDSIVVYAPEGDPKGLGATFTLSVMGSTVVYHLRYQIDRASGMCTYTLDPERTHDIASVEGSYRLETLPQGIRLIYQSRTDAGRAVPGFVKNWLASSSIKTQLEAMRKDARG